MKRSVLVVDDETSFLASVAEGLSFGENGYRVVTAVDGEDAINQIIVGDFSAIMTDLKMPGVDGYQLVSWLATNRPGLPVIVMTAFGTPAIHEQVVGLGAMSYVEKPIDVKTARSAIAEILTRSDANAVIGLVDVVRLMLRERRSCIIRCGFAQGEGAIAIRDGVIAGARLGEHTDLAAAAEMRRLSVLWWAFDMADTASAQELRSHLALSPSPVDLKLKDFAGGLPAGGVPADDEPATPRRTAAPSMLDTHLGRALTIEGALAVAVIDVPSASVVKAIHRDASFDVNLAAHGNATVLRANLKVLDELGLGETMEELVITTSSSLHLFRVMSRFRGKTLYLALARNGARLALAQLQLAELERVLEL